MPIEDDLVRRTLADLAGALDAWDRRRDPDASARARGLLDAAYRRHLGVGGDVVRRLPSDELLAIISTTGRVDGERAFLTAALLELDAAAPDRGEAEAAGLRVRAIDLYAEAGSARVGEADLTERLRRLRIRLHEHRLPEPTYRRLLRWWHDEGAFAAAEDLLFEWLEEHGATGALRTAGDDFYEALEGASDEALDAGDLPRDEVREGRATFLRSCGPVPGGGGA